MTQTPLQRAITAFILALLLLLAAGGLFFLFGGGVFLYERVQDWLRGGHFFLLLMPFFVILALAVGAIAWVHGTAHEVQLNQIGAAVELRAKIDHLEAELAALKRDQPTTQE